MSKFNYRENYNVKKLNSVIKYKKTKIEHKQYITRNGIRTDQKVFKNDSFRSLLNYIKKEGNNFETRKKINKEEGVKHLIISPVSPEKYNQLNEEEQKKLKEITIKTLYKEFNRWGMFGGLEHKSRNIDGKELEHFHVHLAVNSNYDINLKNISRLKRSLANEYLKEPTLKDKLGLKTTKELKQTSIKKTLFKKNENLYKEKYSTMENLKFLFSEITLINKEYRNEFKINRENIAEGYEYIKDLNREQKRIFNEVYKEKTFLFEDIKQTKEVVKYKYNEMNELNDKIKETIKYSNINKDITKYILEEELKSLQNNLNNDYNFFKNYLDEEHNIYVYSLKQQLKNKIIDLPTFLYRVAINKNYKKNRLFDKNEEIKLKIKKKKEEIKNKLKEIDESLKREIKYINTKKEYIKFSIEFNNKNIENLYNKLGKIDKKKEDIHNNFLEKIEIIKKYIAYKQKEFNELQLKKELEQRKIQRQIQREKEKLNKINNEVNKIKEYNKKVFKLKNEEILEILELFKKENPNTKITAEILIKFIEKYLKGTDGSTTSPTTKRKRNFKFGM